MEQTNLTSSGTVASPAKGACPQRLVFTWAAYAFWMAALWHFAGTTWSQAAIWILAFAIGAYLAPSLWEV